MTLSVRGRAETAAPRAGGTKLRRSRAVPVLILLVIILIAAVVVSGIMDRHHIADELARATAVEAVPVVSVVSPKPGPSDRALDLPANLAAWYEAPIYGQVSGYVRAWYADHGANVKAGQVLATIDTPYLDEQIDKAKSNLLAADARFNLAVVTSRRWQALGKANAVSQQSIDENVAAVAARKAEYEAAQHNVARFEALAAFEKITAPFDSIVTARLTDVGAYVDARGASGAASDAGASEAHSAPLFKVTDVHALRVFVSIPQADAGALAPGVTATFTVARVPGRVFEARLLTSAKAFDTRSRTVVTELTVDNAEGLLWPGTFGTVHFPLPTDRGGYVIPAQSLLFRSEGLLVVAVDATDHAHLRKVEAGHNLGATAQIPRGVTAEDRIVANPSEALQEGEQVTVVTPRATRHDG